MSMTSHVDIVIERNSLNDRGFLLRLKADKSLGVDSHVVYIYYLESEFINYPNKNGNIIYIGEAGRPSEPTAKRFGQHISTEEEKGGDNGTVYSLSRYYWLGKQIRLKIFLMETELQRKTLERKLINAHVKEFGALPISQGTTGNYYKTSKIIELDITQELLFFQK